MQGRVLFCAVALAALAACGGGGGGSSVPSGPTNPTPATSATPGTATVEFTVGQGKAVQIVRAPKYVSPYTESVVVTYAGKNYAVDFIQGTSGCMGALPNLSCTVQFIAPTGSDTFAIAAYDQYNGNGNLLSKTSVTVNVAAGVNKVSAVLDGQPVYADVQKAVNLPEGVATSVPFTVTAYDADRAAIVGPGNYATPIALSDGDTSGATIVSATATGPGTQPTVLYNGTGIVPYGSYITASVNGNTTQGSATGLLRIVPQYSQYATHSGQYISSIAAASDGSLWMVEGGTPFGVSMLLAHVSANGSATEIPLSASLGQGVAASIVGPDGALWCVSGPMQGASSAEVLRIDAAGNVTQYPNASLSNYLNQNSMVLGPDNRMWFVQRDDAVAIDTSGNFTFYPAPTTPSGLAVTFGDITLGPDGNLWATDGSQGGLVRITTSGVMTYFATPGLSPTQIIRQGTALLVLSSGSYYRIDTSGNVLNTYTVPLFLSGHIELASNGAVWIPMGTDVAGGSVIGRISASGSVSTIAIPYPNDPGNGAPQVTSIVSAADGSMWYLRGVTYGRIVVH